MAPKKQKTNLFSGGILANAAETGAIESSIVNEEDDPLFANAKMPTPKPAQPSNDQEIPSWASDHVTDTNPSRIVTIPIGKIRPGRYQKRETVDPEKYQQLKDQILELGFQFVAILCVDPDDSAYYNLMMGGHLRIKRLQS